MIFSNAFRIIRKSFFVVYQVILHFSGKTAATVNPLLTYDTCCLPVGIYKTSIVVCLRPACFD